jgi:membrane protein YdbS with pleckstrin-like domain
MIRGMKHIRGRKKMSKKEKSVKSKPLMALLCFTTVLFLLIIGKIMGHLVHATIVILPIIIATVLVTIIIIGITGLIIIYNRESRRIEAKKREELVKKYKEFPVNNMIINGRPAKVTYYDEIEKEGV